MPMKIVLSSGPGHQTSWQEVSDTQGLSYLGRLPVTKAEIYTCEKLSSAQSLWEAPATDELASVLCEWVAESFPRMPRKTDDFIRSDLSLLPFQAPELLQDSEQEWVFYGGSFNPWHDGHQACLELMPEGPKLVVVPDRNPWKKNAKALSWRELWELTLKVRKSGHSLYPGFFMMSEPNPTVSWLPKVQGKTSLLLGDDNLCQIRKWKDHEQLLSCLTSLYVAPRQVNSELRPLIDESLEYVRSFGVRVVRLEHHDFEHLSSTEIRAKKRPS